MCHALLHNPSFFRLLRRIDEELADEARRRGCRCGGALHRANYPRKPRGCPGAVRAEFESRLSFCCGRCRRRTTSMSVRFLGRRVYVALMMVLASARHAEPMPARTGLAGALGVPLRTLARWRAWWVEQLPATSFWRAACARLMPPVSAAHLPASLLARFGDDAAQAMTLMLRFLSPITIGAIR